MVKNKSVIIILLFIFLESISLKGQDSLVVDNINFEELDKKLKLERSYTHISIIASSLNELPKSLLKHKDLEKLVLVGNSLEIVPVWISQFTKLKSLDLSYNRGLKVDTTLKILAGVSNLEELGLRGNHLYYVPRSIFGLKKLKKLNLSRNQMEMLPTEFSWMDSLESLYLDECDNLDFKSVIDVLDSKNIKYLSFYQTHIKELPNDIARFENLEELWLNHTGIEELPDEFVFENLKVLGLAGNSIRKLPDSFKENSSLERLFLTGNELDRSEIEGLRKKMPQTVILF